MPYAAQKKKPTKKKIKKTPKPKFSLTSLKRKKKIKKSTGVAGARM